MSSTFITSPGGTKTPTTGKGTGVLTGAAQGAAAGTMVMPGIGTAVGAAVGAVVGFIGGAQSDKAQAYKKLAYKWDTMGKERQAAISRRDYLRQFRASRATAMTMIGGEEGGTRSSAPQGSVSALGSQFAFGEAFMEGQVMIGRTSAKFMRKAGKSQAASNATFATLEAGASLASTYGASAMNAWQTRSPKGGWGLGSFGNEPYDAIPKPTYGPGWNP